MKDLKNIGDKELRKIGNGLAKEIAKAYKNENKEEAEKLKVLNDKITKELRRRGREYVKKAEREIADKMLKKEELEDGVWYEGPGDFARQVTRARWDEKKGKFIYERYKFGWYEDVMDYFGDVIDTNYAGFAPMKKEEKN